MSIYRSRHFAILCAVVFGTSLCVVTSLAAGAADTNRETVEKAKICGLLSDAHARCVFQAMADGYALIQLTGRITRPNADTDPLGTATIRFGEFSGNLDADVPVCKEVSSHFDPGKKVSRQNSQGIYVECSPQVQRGKHYIIHGTVVVDGGGTGHMNDNGLVYNPVKVAPAKK